MTTFGILLKTYRERAGLSQDDLAAQAGLSASTISRVESGKRSPLRRRKQVIALAKTLGLTQDETDALLSAADFAPSTAPELSLHPRDETLYRIAQELEMLRTDSQITPAQIRFVEETLLLILRGARAALPETDLAVVPSGTPTARPLSEEERYLNDLLGDFMAGKVVSGAMPFTVFAAVARSPRWELKRRLAEALPALLAGRPTVQGPQSRAEGKPTAWGREAYLVREAWASERGMVAPPRGGEPHPWGIERIVPLMETLRDDPPDPEWRTDIRRRIIEATPALWRVRPKAVAPLLRWREGDEVYAVLATLDTLADIGDVTLSSEIRADLLAHADGEHRQVVTLYAQLLDHCIADPDMAIRTIDDHWEDEERLIRVCLARLLHRLLPSRPAETLKRMRYFLRHKDGQPVEHQNVRRAVARHPIGLIGLLSSPYDDTALSLLHTLAADRDVHIRRAICDVLSDVVAQSPEIALDLIEEYLLQDRDRFVQERTWNALRQLMSTGSERAEELCARLIEIA